MADQDDKKKTSATSFVQVNKNKSPQQYIDEVSKKYIVPPLVREKFPNLLKLIFETESMNDDEREYWLQIMPIMTEEQITKLINIMEKEKNQLAKLDEEYQKEMARIKGKSTKEISEDEVRERLAKIKAAEKKSVEAEKGEAEELLKKLESL